MQLLPFAGLSEIPSGLPKLTSAGTLYFTEKDLIKQQLSFTDKSYLISLSQQLGYDERVWGCTIFSWGIPTEQIDDILSVANIMV